MPDSDNKPSTPDTDEAGLGARLREARESRNLSMEQASEALHLDEVVLHALEEGRFEVLGAPVFIKGHLKSYGRWLGLPVDELLGAYHASDVANAVLSHLPDTADRSLTINPVTWGFYVLIALLAGALMIYVLQDDGEAPVSLSRTAGLAEIVEEPAGEALAVISEPAVQSLDTDDGPGQSLPEGSAPNKSGVAADSGTITEPALSLPSPAAQTLADSSVRLGLFFRSESWVEISDTRQRLLFGLQRQGIRRNLTGEPPFNLLLGNSDGVDLYVNDVRYPIPADHVMGNVARFVIDESAVD